MNFDEQPALVEIAILATDFGFQPVRLMKYLGIEPLQYDFSDCAVYNELFKAANRALEIRQAEQLEAHTTHFNVINRISEAVVKASQPDQSARWYSTTKRGNR